MNAYPTIESFVKPEQEVLLKTGEIPKHEVHRVVSSKSFKTATSKSGVSHAITLARMVDGVEEATSYWSNDRLAAMLAEWKALPDNATKTCFLVYEGLVSTKDGKRSYHDFKLSGQ